MNPLGVGTLPPGAPIVSEVAEVFYMNPPGAGALPPGILIVFEVAEVFHLTLERNGRILNYFTKIFVSVLSSKTVGIFFGKVHSS